MSKFAWVTLTTNDNYSLGALVLAHSLRRAGTVHQLAVLITPGVSESMRQKLKDVYNIVQEVNVMDSQDSANLTLLARPELGITFTKLHCWRLVQFEKCVFLDSDTLILQNCDELFEREEFSAAPDVSWPDCFNSGVFVYKPSQATFDKIVEFAVKNGSFDGGDQGLLNQYFADWATSDIKKRLPFLYNVTAYASYCYLPAFKQFRDKIKILHFAGKMKPWLIHYNSQSRTASVPTDYAHANDLIQMWWNIFFDHVHAQLNTDMLTLVKEVEEQDTIVNEENNNKEENKKENEKEERYSCPTLMPWKCNYDNMRMQQQQAVEEMQQQQQQHIDYHDTKFQYQEQFDDLYKNNDQIVFHDPWEDYYRKQEDAINEISNNTPEVPEQSVTEEIVILDDDKDDDISTFNTTQEPEQATTHLQNDIEATEISSSIEPTIDVENITPVLRNDDSSNTATERYLSDNVIDIDCDDSSDFQSALSQQTLVCTSDESFDRPSTSRSLSIDSTTYDTTSLATLNEDNVNVNESQKEAGLAGALSQLRLGEQRSPEQESYEHLMRRQCWEAGQVDYLGRDSFDNIWKKITQTMETKPTDDKTEMLTSADIEDGKVEFDQKTGVKVEYHKIEGGYQVKTTTPQPNGGWKSATQTFYDPKPVSEEDMKKQMANKKLIKTRLNKEIRIDSKTTMLTREIEGGYEEVYTTVNDDGTKSIKTKTFFDAVPEGTPFPDGAQQKPAAQQPGSKKTILRKASVESTDSTDSRKLVQKVNKNSSLTTEESRRVTQNIEITENNRTVRKNSLQTEQTTKSITSSNDGDNKKKKIVKKSKVQAPPPPADFIQNDTTTVSTQRVPGGTEYTYSTQLESGKTITTSKTVYEEEECELTEEEIRAYKKTLKDAEKHKNVTTTKKLKSESGTKKVVPSENPGDVTTVETIKIQGGTEYHYTTVTSEGIVKKAVKTVYDPVPCSNPDDTEEEEIIEEYEEEIIEPGEKNVKTIETIRQLPHKFEEEVTITHEKKEKKTKKTMTMMSH